LRDKKEKCPVSNKIDWNGFLDEFLNPISKKHKYIEDLEKLAKLKNIYHVTFSNITDIATYIKSISNLIIC